MIRKNAMLLAGWLLLVMPACAHAGDWGDTASTRCWGSDSSRMEWSACLFKELEEKRALMQQFYDEILRDAEKRDVLFFDSRLEEFHVDSNDPQAKEAVRNGPGSHAWQTANRLRASQVAYQAYIEAEKARIMSYIPGNGGEAAAAQHELNLLQDRMVALKKI